MAILRRFLPVPVLALMALGACDLSPGIDTEGGTPVACALRGASDFASECRLVETGSHFVMRHPDGGFRTLAAGDSPSGLVEFDGAQRAESRRMGDEIVLIIGEDRYRWEAPRDE
jgi:hypothetical protein